MTDQIFDKIVTVIKRRKIMSRMVTKILVRNGCQSYFLDVYSNVLMSKTRIVTRSQ